MIIPTPEYDPMFADDGIPFATKMLRYIEREFADILVPRPNMQSLPIHSSTAPSASQLKRDPSVRAAA